MKKLTSALCILSIFLSVGFAHAEPLDQVHFDPIEKNLVQFAVENIVIGLAKNDSYSQDFESSNHLSCIMMILDMMVAQDIITETTFESELAKSDFSPEELEYSRTCRDLEAEYMMKHSGHKWGYWRNILGVAMMIEEGLLPSTTAPNCQRLAEEILVAFLPLLQPLPPGESIMDPGPKD